MGLHDLKAAQMGGKWVYSRHANKFNQLALRFIHFNKLSFELRKVTHYLLMDAFALEVLEDAKSWNWPSPVFTTPPKPR
ncbi:hypothetical protein K443DRAFT_15232 [Laccaria amethystina LaAM-08-1]|uniref:Uncharacterized protein n=1 Tax=Laccaria amethystina LaAM-08-1 TaxID=1095629 RepID=A0A0C9WYK5_9AGAR|nr:hypothetical protein K443DRAFT_15232 [Laccaria amethystina LaAM-08-1]